MPSNLAANSARVSRRWRLATLLVAVATVPGCASGPLPQLMARWKSGTPQGPSDAVVPSDPSIASIRRPAPVLLTAGTLDSTAIAPPVADVQQTSGTSSGQEGLGELVVRATPGDLPLLSAHKEAASELASGAHASAAIAATSDREEGSGDAVKRPHAAMLEALPAPTPDETADDAVPVLLLNEAIAAALQNDLVLRAGFQEIAQASAEFVTSSLKPNPELEIIQSLLPLFHPFEADVREGGPPQFDVLLAYPIDWYVFGKRAAAMRSASAEVRVSRAEYADLVRERVLEASVAYYDVMEAQAWVDLARQDADNLLLVEQVTQVAVENGALPRVELSRIRLDRLNSQQTLREAARDLQIAKAQLQAIIGGVIPVAAGVGGDFRVSDQLASESDQGAGAPLHGEVEQAFAIAVANRPDIQALELRIDQGRAEIESQRREAYPEVTPMLGYTHQFQRRAIGFPDADSWGAGVVMTLPVNDRNQGNRLLAAAQWRQSTYELQAGLVELRAEIVTVTAELETARVNAAAIAEDQLRLADEVRDAIRQAYEAGGRPLIDVLDSQRNYRETYGNYISSRADYLRAVQRFNAALGGQVSR